MTKPTAILLILLMTLSGCTNPESTSSDDGTQDKPVLIISADWSEYHDSSSVNEVIDFSIDVNSSIYDSWIGVAKVIDPNGNQVSDLSWSRGFDSGSLYFVPNIIGNYTVTINLQAGDSSQRYIVEGGNLTHVVEILPPNINIIDCCIEPL